MFRRDAAETGSGPTTFDKRLRFDHLSIFYGGPVVDGRNLERRAYIHRDDLSPRRYDVCPGVARRVSRRNCAMPNEEPQERAQRARVIVRELCTALPTRLFLFPPSPSPSSPYHLTNEVMARCYSGVE